MSAATPSLRSFNRNDWYGYEGAEELPSGARPMIGERPLPDGKTMIVLVTGDGETETGSSVSAQILWPGDAEEEWWFARRWTEEGAVDLGTFLLRGSLSVDPADQTDYRRVLSALGFQRTL